MDVQEEGLGLSNERKVRNPFTVSKGPVRSFLSVEVWKRDRH